LLHYRYASNRQRPQLLFAHNPFVYVASKPNVITHFDFWPGYAQSASPNDSALFISHSTSQNIRRTLPPPISSIILPAYPSMIPRCPASTNRGYLELPEFTGAGAQATGEIQTNPMRESDSSRQNRSRRI